MGSEGQPTTPSDRGLVVAFQNGDRAAYDEIFRRYHDRVASICRNMLRTPQDAEEATQETFLKAYQALGRFNGSYYLGAWLSRIATNVCVDHLRSKSRSNLVALPEDPENLITEEGPEEIIVGGHPRLHRAIQDIQPLHASALALRAVEGLSHQEIAGHLHMSPSQVKALLHRARCSLRRAWDKAEGWAFAPLFALRHVLNDRATNDAGRIASLSPSAAPFIMERVAAASAMIVAAALTGVPSAPSVGGTSPREVTAQEVVAAPFRAQEAEPGAAVDGAGTSQRPGGGPVLDVSGTEEVALVPDVAIDLPKPLHEKQDQEDSHRRPRDDDDDPIGPTSAEGDKAVRKVRKIASEVSETLGP